MRSKAAEYGSALEPARRKRLGQFFTGLPLGRLLAALALDREARTVLDPMAGHGDLLDAVIERANRLAQGLTRVEGVEIDPPTAETCRARLAPWRDSLSEAAINIRTGDAFAPDSAEQYATGGYDLVITNPPYVRYQTLATHAEHAGNRAPTEIRRDLLRAIQDRVGAGERSVWQTIVKSYSGLADLSVPAWILAGALVRPGGMLALVAPATWRSRNYGDTIKYLLSRCFRIEFLVEDTQPGWFSDALVRTQLVLARRLPEDEARVPLAERPQDGRLIVTARVSPEASGQASLVGSSFTDADPERGFADWMRRLATGAGEGRPGVSSEAQPLSALTDAVASSLRARKWFRAVEPSDPAGALFGADRFRFSSALIPAPVRAAVGEDAALRTQLPEEAGVAISQGLRTGCNGFFYVDFVEALPGERARIRLGGLFRNDEVVVPAACLLPVLRRQSEHVGRLRASRLPGRVLDLGSWLLPENAAAVERSRRFYIREGLAAPQVMPPELAEFVRRASETAYGDEPGAKRIPDLSAVCTNARTAADRAPRFWYMLPPFARRHRPDAFVPRINQGIPSIEQNDDPPVLIDANFSTLWGEAPPWTGAALYALFNSSWCRACMEALGTPMGGGALKLEATQLKRMPIPVLEGDDIDWLDRAGRVRGGEGVAIHGSLDAFVIGKLTGFDGASPRAEAMNRRLGEVAAELCSSRQKRRP